MVRENRIKTYWMAPQTGSIAQPNVYTKEAINGELLRIKSFSNFTGSIVITESGTGLQFVNATVTSGTGLWTHIPLTNTTGSFMTSNNLQIMASGLASGTLTVWGPVEILYR